MKDRTTLARWTPRRLLSLLMALIMTLSLLPTAALAAAGDYTLNVTGAPGQLFTQQESADITANLTADSSASPVDVRLKITVKRTDPSGSINPADCTIQYNDATSSPYTPVTTTHDPTAGTITGYLGASGLSTLSPGGTVSANFKLSFNAAGSYTVEVEAVSVDSTGAETGPLVSKTLPIEVKDAIESLTVTPTDPEAGQPFTVRADTNVNSGYVVFEYNNVPVSAPVIPLLDNKGYAEYKDLIAVAGKTEVKATLTGAAGIPDATKAAPVNVGTPATYHTVTFRANGDNVYTLPAPQTVKSGEKAVEPIAPERKGYTFDGWYKEPTCTNTAKYDFTTDTVTGNLELYAKWTAKQVNVIANTPTVASAVKVSFVAAGMPVTNAVQHIGANVTFYVTVPAEYDPSTILAYAGYGYTNYKDLAPVAQSELRDSTTGNVTAVKFQYQFELTENLVDPTTNKVYVGVYDTVASKTFTVMMPTGHFNAEITGVDTAGSTVAADKKSASIVYGGSYTFTVTPDTGYDVAVYVNGVAKAAGTDGKYTVADVTGPQRVEVVESAIPNYNVTFTVPQSGELFTQTVMSGGKANKPAVDPIREGYTFEGWYTATEYKKTNGDQFNFTTETITEDTVLYGKLTPKTYMITYDGNGSDGGTVPTPQPKTHGTAIILSTNVPTRTGYTFLGWGMTATATAANYQPGDPYSVDGNIKLFAVWQKNTYTITLPTGQGYSINTAQSTTVTHGGSFTFTVTVAREYAQVPPVVTVTSGSGTLSTPTTVSNPDQSVSYTYTISDIKADQIVSVSVSQNLMFTVTFEAPVGKFYTAQQVEQGSIATRPADPVVEGYKFDGWYKDVGLTIPWDFATEKVIGPTTIYAKLTAITPKITWVSPATGYTIAVEGTKAGETSVTTLNSNDKVVYGSTVTFTITISKGYDASKMQVGINGQLLAPKEINGDDYIFEFTAKQDTKITVVGVARKTVTIIYNDNGGYGGPVQETVNYFLPSDVHNGKISKTVPTREGYDFKGWSTDNKAAWDATGNLQPGAESPFTSDTVLYAVWQAKETGIKLEVSNTIDDTATSKAQYEGENVTLTATVKSSGSGASVTTGSVQFYRCTDADPTATTATWTLLNSAVVSGGTAIYKAETSGFKYGDTNKDTYKAVFIPTEGNGYTEITSDTKAVTVKSTAISWKLDATAAPAIGTDANVLTITDKNGDPVTAMVAGQVYTLELPAIYALDELNTKLTVNKDYSVTWQYRNDKGVWTDYTNSGSGDTTTVDAAYSQYVFRAVVTPVTGATSHFTKAAKYDTSALVKDQYETMLISEPTTEVTLQTTKTDLVITGHNIEEDAGTVINGTAKFRQKHLAQFEGQTVILKATVIDSTSKNAVADGGKVYFYRYVDGKNDVKLNQTAIVVNNGIAELSDVIIKAYDASTGKYFNSDANIDRFYAVYEGDATYATSASVTYDASTGYAKPVSVKAATADSIFVKSTAIKTPIIESKLANEANEKATTYIKDLTGLLAGVQHEFKLRQTGADGVSGQTDDWSVVALDGRTVEAKNYDIEWQYKTNDNFAKAGNDSTAAIYTTKTTEVGDQYRVVLKAKGDMKTDATSKVAEIGKKQDVTVTVEASDEINSTAETDVYQLNEITLTATVAAKETSSTMKPTGTVTFYYKDGSNWVKLGSAALAEDTDHNMTASIPTTELPVDKTANTKRDVEITAVYEGNETFKESATATATGASHTIAATPNCTTNNKTVTVYSSVVYVDSAENTTNTPGTHGIAITTEGGKVLANETKVNLKLSEVYTLDHATDAADKALLAYGTDYTVQWQMLSNAAAYPDKAADGTPWTNITSATGTTCQIDVVQGTAYRAVITVKDTPIAKGSYEKIDQGTVGTADKNDGRQVYYSNILVAANAPATLTVNVNTDNTSKGYEGIVEGETVTIHTFTSGATGTTPISQLTVNIYPGKPAEVAAATTPVAPVFTAEKANVNGHVSFDWNKDVTPGYYTLKVKATFTNGYDDKEITRTLIVRDNDYKFELSGDNAVYNGKVQGLKVTVADMGIEDALAQKSVVVYYYTDEARTQQVEPTQAGTYYATVCLQESAYWTEKTLETTFTIQPREVSVVDLVAQAKVYDGTTNANIQEIILNDATVNSTTGLPTDDEGIIDGDSVYAVGTGYTSQSHAGTAKLGVKDVSLKGDDAANYELTSHSYYNIEDFNIQRSQVKGAIVSGRTYKYTGKDIKLAASDIYLIDQAGSQLTDYKVTYYYHNGDGVEKVDAMNKMGKYTVIARPEQDNYKGGATETVYVGNTDAPGTLDNSAKSSLITISNTVELYGATTGVTVSATKGTATASYYYNNGTSADWYTAVPTNAGRYLVKATVTNDGVTDTAYGIYTIVKARPEFTPTTDKSSMEYTSGRYDGAIGAGFVNGKSNDTAETYITYTGGTIQGVAYEAPTEVGKYIATVHVGETANYTAHEKQVAFEITPKALTITADDISRQQYGAYPDLTASFKGLATGGVAADTSLRDVQIQPELIDKSNYSNDASDQVGNNYKIIAVAALARNYTVSYVDGNMSVTREDPKPYLEIRGMIENGDGATDLAYYGDVIQLYAYGNQIKTTTGDVYNTSSILAWSVTGPASITQDGLLTVTGVGDVTVTLKRGIGAQQISTTLTFEAKKQEVKVVVPAEDKVYDGTTQDYTSTKTLSAVNAMGIKVFSGNPRFVITNNTRSDVGSQIVTGKVSDSIHSFQSETYGGLFTINVKDVSVTPNEISVTYGDTLGTLGYTPIDIVSGVPALTDGKAVSEREDYKNLDVLDGYEILVAGRENENYNVKYVTDQDAPDVKVTAKDLIIKTGTLNSDGRTSGYLKDNDQFYKNEGFAITGTTFNLLPNDRMYGEVNPVMDYTFADFVSGDSEADFVTLLPWLVKYSDGTYHNINGNANVAFDKTKHLNGFRAASCMSGMSAYPIDSMLLANSVKNYTLTSAEATQNIYQRPVTLTVPTGVTLTAYKPTILDASDNVKMDVLLDLLLNNLVVGKYNDKGGLAELLKHTIKDLDIKIVSATYNSTAETISVTIELGNKNYWTENLSFTVTVDKTKIVAKYTSFGWTSASVTMVGVDESGHETGPVDVSGKVWYKIYVKDPSITNPKYSDYKGKTPVLNKEMFKGSSTGVYIVDYPSLPAGEYVMFAIAEGYTIIE